MTKTSEPIVFFGSGPVAAASLRLLAQDFTIEAVVTKPRPAHHKGAVPVLELAEELALPIHTVESKADLDVLVAEKPFRSRLAVIIDFGIIVSQAVIDSFPLGIVNSHFSLLPEWRGADPISFAILCGQKQTGVSLMLLVQKMDEGPLLADVPFDIPKGMTTPELTEALIHESHQALCRVLPLYTQGKTQPATQESIAEQAGRSIIATYSRKLTKEDGLLDWAKPAALLEREIRAFIEWPKSRATVNNLDIVVTKAHVVDAKGQPGTTAVLDKLPVIYCGEQALALDRLKPAGKQEMTGEGFLAGYKAQFLG